MPMRLARSSILILFAGLAAAGLGAWFGMHRLASINQPALESLWAAQFHDLSGTPVMMGSLRGKPLVINFWATWCEPCKEEMPDFQRLADSDLGKSLQIVGIGIDSSSNMLAFSKKLGISYLLLESGIVGLDVLKSVGDKAGALPYTLIVDAAGKPVLTHLGRISYDELYRGSKIAIGP